MATGLKRLFKQFGSSYLPWYFFEAGFIVINIDDVLISLILEPSIFILLSTL